MEEAPYGRTASERKRKVIQLWRVWHEMDKMETVAIVLRDNGGKEIERFAAGKMTSMVHISPPATLICTLANEVEPVRHLILHFGTSITFMLHSGFDRYDLLQPFLILRCHLLGPLALATPSLRFCAWAASLKSSLASSPTWRTHLSRSISSVPLLSAAMLLSGDRGKYYRQRADSALPAPDVLRRHLATNMTGPDTLQPVCPRMSFIKYSWLLY